MKLSPVALNMAQIWTFEMAAPFPKWLAVIDMGVIRLYSDFQPYSYESSD